MLTVLGASFTSPFPPYAIHWNSLFPTLNSREKTVVAILVYLILGKSGKAVFFKLSQQDKKPNLRRLSWESDGTAVDHGRDQWRVSVHLRHWTLERSKRGSSQRPTVSHLEAERSVDNASWLTGRGGPRFKRPNMSIPVPPQPPKRLPARVNQKNFYFFKMFNQVHHMVPQGVDLMYKMSTLLLPTSAAFLESRSKGYLNWVHLETGGGVLDCGSPHHFTNKKTESRKKAVCTRILGN